MSSTVADVSGFTNDRFGMFIHFGLYSVAGRHEWVKNRERLTDEEYQPYFDAFDPDLFDAREIAAMARRAGARYVVLTTKHHEGFCLWDSTLTDYTSVAAAGRDLVAEYVAAVRAEGLKVGFYHSLLDWHHPDFTVDGFHPLRGGDLTALNAGREMSRYRAYLHGQVRELLSGYGKIDVLFYDFTYPGEVEGLAGKGPQDWDAETLLALTRELQPGIVVNDRLGIPADYTTPEQFQPTSPVTDRDGNLVVWEVCHTINGSWGYDRDNLAFKAPGIARPDADHVGRQRRQHDPQRRPDRPGIDRSPRRGDFPGGRRLVAAARPVDLRVRPSRPRTTGQLPLHEAR